MSISPEAPPKPSGWPPLLIYLLGLLIILMPYCDKDGDLQKLDALIAVLTLLLYFLPTLIAYHKEKINCLAIFLVNLLLGWTVLGWIGALVWSCTTSLGDLQARAYWRKTEP